MNTWSMQSFKKKPENIILVLTSAVITEQGSGDYFSKLNQRMYPRLLYRSAQTHSGQRSPLEQ